MTRTVLSAALAVALTALAGAANAQSASQAPQTMVATPGAAQQGQPQGWGQQPQGWGQPGQFQGQFQAQPPADPATQLFINQTWGLTGRDGSTTLITYGPNGVCNGMFAARGQQRPTPFACRYQAQTIGQGRLALTIEAQLNGRPVTSRNTFRMTPGGNLFNEQAKAVAYRLQPDGAPYSWN